MPAFTLQRVEPQENTEELQNLLEAELEQCREVNPTYRNKVKKFMESNEIWHISELDYTWRETFERFLAGEVKPSSYSAYLKAFDRLKQHSIRNQMRVLSRSGRQALRYESQLLFLPYHPDQELAERFEGAQKKELVWDFSRDAPETMKHQIFDVLQYMIVHDVNVKIRRRHLVALKKFYSFCVEKTVSDIEKLELSQIQEFRQWLSQETEIKRTVGIIDYCRKAVFLQADEIHWNANVWYMERFHLQPERQDPATPVMSLSFLEVTHKRNRALLQKYLRYGIGITNLSIHSLQSEMLFVRKFLTSVRQEETEDISTISTQQIDEYFKTLQKEPIKEATYNVQVMSILHFFNFLKVKGYLEKVPFYEDYYLKKVVLQHHDRSVDENVAAEILRKLYCFPDELRLMYLHLWGIGLRISEVCTLKGDAYYIQGRDAWVKIYQIKMRTYKKIPIPDALYKLMQVYLKKHGINADDYVFQNSKGGPYRSSTFRKRMIENCTMHQIQNGEYLFKSHDYRHTLATYFYENKVSLSGVRDYLGHEYEEMTQQYVDYMPKRIDKANEAFFDQPGNSLAACIKKEMIMDEQ